MSALGSTSLLPCLPRPADARPSLRPLPPPGHGRRPAHSLRVSPALGSCPAKLCAKLLEQGVAAQPSTYLPREFFRVEAGLQAVLASGLLARGQVQVRCAAADEPPACRCLFMVSLPYPQGL